MKSMNEFSSFELNSNQQWNVQGGGKKKKNKANSSGWNGCGSASSSGNSSNNNSFNGCGWTNACNVNWNPCAPVPYYGNCAQATITAYPFG